MIEIKNLTKSFEGKPVLKDISTTFEEGKTNLIIGRSGSGKTVLIKNIIGLYQPDSGAILYDGRDITQMTKKEIKALRKEMGMLFQGSALFDSMTVLENAMFPLMMFSKESKNEKLKRALFCLERVNLREAGDLYPSEISGGMMKRAAIARAIALNPRYLFCDEPNSGLDPKTSLIIDDLIYDITKEYNITTVINTHDMNSVMNIGENIIFINDGEIAWRGNCRDIIDSDNKALNDFVFASDLFQKVREVELKEEKEEECQEQKK
ncbi:MAG: ATP-binding cassette domain-containing protein [Bacteroidales bacterium]|nr:ATP-binding cassette domain-containing protein [Bacteroidales bacterium]